MSKRSYDGFTDAMKERDTAALASPTGMRNGLPLGSTEVKSYPT